VIELVWSCAMGRALPARKTCVLLVLKLRDPSWGSWAVGSLAPLLMQARDAVHDLRHLVVGKRWAAM